MGYKAKVGDDGMTADQLKVKLFNEMAKATPVKPDVLAGRATGKKIYPASHPMGHK